MKKYSSKIYFSLITLLFVALFLPGCMDNHRSNSLEIEPTDPPEYGEDDVSSVVLDLDIPFGKESGGGLRALSAADEKKIESLRVLMFKVEGSPANETFAYEAPVMNHDNHKATVLLRTSTAGELYRAVLIANSGVSGSSSITEGMSKEDVLSQFTFDVNGQWNSTSSADFRPLPMWGESSSSAVIVGAPVTKPYQKIHLLRAVARVDVGLCLDGPQFDETANRGDTSGVADFTLSEVYVHNANTKGYVAKLNEAISEPSIPTGVVQNSHILEYPVSDALSLREIYLAEATNGAALAHTARPFLVIEGQYKSKKTYYRIDYLKKVVAPSGEVTYEYLPLLRNHRYKINITRIGGKGFDSEEEAAQSTAANIDYDVTVWNESAVTNVVYDGQYMLGVSEDNLTYYNHAHTKEITVRTSWPQGWKATVTKGAEWMSINPSNGAADTDVTLGIAVRANDTDDAVERHGVVTITAGRMTWLVNVKQLPEGEISLEIYDEDGVTPISMLEFKGDGETKKIVVKYAPSDPTKGTFTGPVLTNLSHYVFQKIEGESEVGKAVYNVTAPAMVDKKNPFESVTDVSQYTIEAEGKKASKALVLIQTEYNAVPFEDGALTKVIDDNNIPFFLMDGSTLGDIGADDSFEDKIYIKANTRYTIRMIKSTNKSMIDTADQTLPLIESGFPLDDSAVVKKGKFSGEKMPFVTANDLQAPKRFIGEVEFEITSPDGLFAPRRFKLLIASGILQPEANTYFMKPGNIAIIIPVSQIDKAADYYNKYQTDFQEYINQRGKDLEGRTWEANFKLPKLDKNRPWDVEVLWAEVMNTYPDNEPVVSGNDPEKGVLYILTKAGKDYIFVMPSYNHTGNVIIGLKQDGKIMWSWHLWLVDSFPSSDPVKLSYNPDNKWLDRDLGAFGVTEKANGRFDNYKYEQHGLLYQWGRKDPFPLLKVKNKSVLEGTGRGKRNTKLIDAKGHDYYNDFIDASKHVKPVGTMKEMINNPTVYYSTTSGRKFEEISPFLELPNGSSSFTVNSAYAALWGGVALKREQINFNAAISPTNKTPFDPSPYGWKVPNSGREGNWGRYRPRISTVDGTSDFYIQESSSESFPNMSGGDSESFRWTSTRMTNSVKGRYIYGTGDDPSPADNTAHSTSAGIMVRSVENTKELNYNEYLPTIKVKR